MKQKTITGKLIKTLGILTTAFLVTTACMLFSHAADGATITSPQNQSITETGKEVKIKVKPEYQLPDGSPNILGKRWKNYIYFKVSLNGTTILYEKTGYTSILGGVSDQTKSFKPTEEGPYLIEVCRHLQYENGNYVELPEGDFVPGDSVTITVQKDISKAQTEVTGITDKIYNGNPQTQTPTVTVDGKQLVPETDYTVACENNVDKGTARVTITGTGFYKGQVVREFQIGAADISTATVSGIVNYTYNGSGCTQDPIVTMNGRTLVRDTDYELSYKNNVNAGNNASCTVTGKGNYEGSVTKDFMIEPLSIKNATITGIEEKNYSGSPITQNLTVSCLGRTLSSKNDYSVAYQNNTQPGTATITITGKGNFSQSTTRTFSIKEVSTASGGYTTIFAPENGMSYAVGDEIEVQINGKYQTPTYGTTVLTGVENYLYLKITRDGQRVAYGKIPYTSTNQIIHYPLELNAKGTYTIQLCRDVGTYIVDANNSLQYQDIAYEDFVPATSVTVYVGLPGRKNLSSATVTGVTDKEYTGNSITQSPTVKVDGTTLKNGTDYYLLYSNNLDVGTATLTINGKGNYSGSITRQFDITKKQLTERMITLSPGSFTYNGELQKPSVVVKNGDMVLSESIDYTLVNEGGVNPGEYSVTITAVSDSNNMGSATKKYVINKIPIDSAVVTTNPTSYDYDGTAKKPAVTVKLNGKTLSKDLYTVSYSKNTNAGSATAKVTAKGDNIYRGSASGTFTIRKAEIGTDTVTVAPIANQVYSGQALTPPLRLIFGSTELTQGTDFSAACQNNINTGTATVTITGKGNFKGTRNTSFRIIPKRISVPAGKTLTYNGKALTGVPANASYSAGGNTATNAGSYTATLTLKDKTNYRWNDGTTAAKKVAWKINKASQAVTVKTAFTKIFGNAAFSLGARTNGDGTLKYTSGNPKVAAVSAAGRVTLKGAGTAKITVYATAGTNYKQSGKKTVTIKVNKAANPLTIKGKTAALKDSAVREKAQTLVVTRVIDFTKKGQGTMTYAKESGDAKITINKTSGQVTVKKGLKKNTYKVKVKVSAGGNANYKAGNKTVTFTVAIK